MVWIPVVTGCAPLVAGLFLFCYERDFVLSFSDDRQADVVGAFNTTSRCLGGVLDIDNVCFGSVVCRVCPS